MTKIYVGNIPNDTRQEELEDGFSKFGRIETIWLARNPPGFGFVTFEDARDADDAIREMDGREFLGSKIRVEVSKGRPDRRGRSRSRSRERGSRDTSRYAGEYRGSRPARSTGVSHSSFKKGEFRVIVKNLSSRVSWQDLKDFLRRGGEVCYTDVRDGEGVADFLTADDMERAVRKLDGTSLEGRTVTLVEDRPRGRSRSRSRSKPKRSYSRGRSRSRSRSRRRSRSRSASGGRDRKRARDD